LVVTTATRTGIPAQRAGNAPVDDDDEDYCNAWMPRARTTCARRPLHLGDHRTAKSLEDTRERLTARRTGLRLHVDPAARARWNRTYRLSQYGLTPDQFARLLEVQGYACGMCREPFEDHEPICIDHDHACCPDEKRSCGRCLRGLLCTDCNTALGHIEKRLAIAKAYLSHPPASAPVVLSVVPAAPGVW
jgi:hypothetical protein